MGIFLYLLSILVGMIILPLGFLYGFFKCLYKKHFILGLKNLDKKFLHLAECIDRYGNVACYEIMNDLLITKVSIDKFGNGHETISSVIGRNKKANTLTQMGKALDKFLCWLEKDHSINSIGF